MIASYLVCVPSPVYEGTLCLVHSNRFWTGRTRNFHFIILILAAADAANTKAYEFIAEFIKCRLKCTTGVLIASTGPTSGLTY